MEKEKKGEEEKVEEMETKMRVMTNMRGEGKCVRRNKIDVRRREEDDRSTKGGEEVRMSDGEDDRGMNSK